VLGEGIRRNVKRHVMLSSWPRGGSWLESTDDMKRGMIVARRCLCAGHLPTISLALPLPHTTAQFAGPEHQPQPPSIQGLCSCAGTAQVHMLVADRIPPLVDSTPVNNTSSCKFLSCICRGAQRGSSRSVSGYASSAT
jgi:hypothetical protein